MAAAGGEPALGAVITLAMDGPLVEGARRALFDALFRGSASAMGMLVGDAALPPPSDAEVAAAREALTEYGANERAAAPDAVARTTVDCRRLQPALALASRSAKPEPGLDAALAGADEGSTCDSAAPPPPPLDLLVVDAEGADAEVVRQALEECDDSGDGDGDGDGGGDGGGCRGAAAARWQRR